MKRINEFKGYRSETHYDESAGAFVMRRAEDAIGAQEPAGTFEDIEIRHPGQPKEAARKPKPESLVKSSSGARPVSAPEARCEARIMFDMVAVIGSRNLARASCAMDKL